MLEQEQRLAEMARLRQNEQQRQQQPQTQPKLAPWAKKGQTAEVENGGSKMSMAEIQRIEREEKMRREAEEAEERKRFAQAVNCSHLLAAFKLLRLIVVHVGCYRRLRKRLSAPPR